MLGMAENIELLYRIYMNLESVDQIRRILEEGNTPR